MVIRVMHFHWMVSVPYVSITVRCQTHSLLSACTHPQIQETSVEQTADRRERPVLAAGAVLRKAKEGENMPISRLPAELPRFTREIK